MPFFQDDLSDAPRSSHANPASGASAEMPRYLYRDNKVWALRIKTITPDIDRAHQENRDTDDGAWITPVEEGYGDIYVSNDFVKANPIHVGGYYVVDQTGCASYLPASEFDVRFVKA